MEDILKKFIAISDEPYKWLSAWKEANHKKLFACYPMYVPEEFVHAAGGLPFIIQRSSERMDLSSRFFQSVYCDFARSTFDLILKGKLDHVDGILTGDTCYVNRALTHMRQTVRPDFYGWDIDMVKPVNKPSARAYLLDELGRFKASLEEFTGSRITEELLWKSIAVYNENRGQIRKLYDLRRSSPGLITAREMLAIVRASMLMPKEEHTRLLAQLMPLLKKRKPAPNGRVKFVLSGTMCEETSVDILDFIEDLGGVIVDDDLYVGSRYVAVDCPPAANPMESIAERYVNQVPCPTLYNVDRDWGDYLVNMVKKAKAEAVVVLLVLHCEPHLYAYPNVKNRLNAAGIPHYYLEMEQESLSLGRIRTKMEAFIETVEKGKGRRGQ